MKKSLKIAGILLIGLAFYAAGCGRKGPPITPRPDSTGFYHLKSPLKRLF